MRLELLLLVFTLNNNIKNSEWLYRTRIHCLFLPLVSTLVCSFACLLGCNTVFAGIKINRWVSHAIEL